MWERYVSRLDVRSHLLLEEARRRPGLAVSLLVRSRSLPDLAERPAGGHVSRLFRSALSVTVHSRNPPQPDQRILYSLPPEVRERSTAAPPVESIPEDSDVSTSSADAGGTQSSKGSGSSPSDSGGGSKEGSESDDADGEPSDGTGKSEERVAAALDDDSPPPPSSHRDTTPGDLGDRTSQAALLGSPSDAPRVFSDSSGDHVKRVYPTDLLAKTDTSSGAGGRADEMVGSEATTERLAQRIETTETHRDPRHSGPRILTYEIVEEVNVFVRGSGETRVSTSRSASVARVPAAIEGEGTRQSEDGSATGRLEHSSRTHKVWDYRTKVLHLSPKCRQVVMSTLDSETRVHDTPLEESEDKETFYPAETGEDGSEPPSLENWAPDEPTLSRQRLISNLEQHPSKQPSILQMCAAGEVLGLTRQSSEQPPSLEPWVSDQPTSLEQQQPSLESWVPDKPSNLEQQPQDQAQGLDQPPSLEPWAPDQTSNLEQQSQEQPQSFDQPPSLEPWAPDKTSNLEQQPQEQPQSLDQPPSLKPWTPDQPSNLEQQPQGQSQSLDDPPSLNPWAPNQSSTLEQQPRSQPQSVDQPPSLEPWAPDQPSNLELQSEEQPQSLDQPPSLEPWTPDQRSKLGQQPRGQPQSLDQEWMSDQSPSLEQRAPDRRTALDQRAPDADSPPDPQMDSPPTVYVAAPLNIAASAGVQEPAGSLPCRRPVTEPGQEADGFHYDQVTGAALSPGAPLAGTHGGVPPSPFRLITNLEDEEVQISSRGQRAESRAQPSCPAATVIASGITEHVTVTSHELVTTSRDPAAPTAPLSTAAVACDPQTSPSGDRPGPDRQAACVVQLADESQARSPADAPDIDAGSFVDRRTSSESISGNGVREKAMQEAIDPETDPVPAGGMASPAREHSLSPDKIQRWSCDPPAIYIFEVEEHGALLRRDETRFIDADAINGQPLETETEAETQPLASAGSPRSPRTPVEEQFFFFKTTEEEPSLETIEEEIVEAFDESSSSFSSSSSSNHSKNTSRDVDGESLRSDLTSASGAYEVNLSTSAPAFDTESLRHTLDQAIDPKDPDKIVDSSGREVGAGGEVQTMDDKIQDATTDEAVRDEPLNLMQLSSDGSLRKAPDSVCSAREAADASELTSGRDGVPSGSGASVSSNVQADRELEEASGRLEVMSSSALFSKADTEGGESGSMTEPRSGSPRLPETPERPGDATREMEPVESTGVLKDDAEEIEHKEEMAPPGDKDAESDARSEQERSTQVPVPKEAWLETTPTVPSLSHAVSVEECEEVRLLEEELIILPPISAVIETPLEMVSAAQRWEEVISGELREIPNLPWRNEVGIDETKSISKNADERPQQTCSEARTQSADLPQTVVDSSSESDVAPPQSIHPPPGHAPTETSNPSPAEGLSVVVASANRSLAFEQAGVTSSSIDPQGTPSTEPPIDTDAAASDPGPVQVGRATENVEELQHPAVEEAVKVLCYPDDRLNVLEIDLELLEANGEDINCSGEEMVIEGDREAHVAAETVEINHQFPEVVAVMESVLCYPKMTEQVTMSEFELLECVEKNAQQQEEHQSRDGSNETAQAAVVSVEEDKQGSAKQESLVDILCFGDGSSEATTLTLEQLCVIDETGGDGRTDEGLGAEQRATEKSEQESQGPVEVEESPTVLCLANTAVIDSSCDQDVPFELTTSDKQHLVSELQATECNLQDSQNLQAEETKATILCCADDSEAATTLDFVTAEDIDVTDGQSSGDVKRGELALGAGEPYYASEITVSGVHGPAVEIPSVDFLCRAGSEMVTVEEMEAEVLEIDSQYARLHSSSDHEASDAGPSEADALKVAKAFVGQVIIKASDTLERDAEPYSDQRRQNETALETKAYSGEEALKETIIVTQFSSQCEEDGTCDGTTEATIAVSCLITGEANIKSIDEAEGKPSPDHQTADFGTDALDQILGTASEVISAQHHIKQESDDASLTADIPDVLGSQASNEAVEPAAVMRSAYCCGSEQSDSEKEVRLDKTEEVISSAQGTPHPGELSDEQRAEEAVTDIDVVGHSTVPESRRDTEAYDKLPTVHPIEVVEETLVDNGMVEHGNIVPNSDAEGFEAEKEVHTVKVLEASVADIYVAGDSNVPQPVDEAKDSEAETEVHSDEIDHKVADDCEDVSSQVVGSAEEVHASDITTVLQLEESSQTIPSQPDASNDPVRNDGTEPVAVGRSAYLCGSHQGDDETTSTADSEEDENTTSSQPEPAAAPTQEITEITTVDVAQFTLSDLMIEPGVSETLTCDLATTPDLSVFHTSTDHVNEDSAASDLGRVEREHDAKERKSSYGDSTESDKMHLYAPTVEEKTDIISGSLGTEPSEPRSDDKDIENSDAVQNLAQGTAGCSQTAEGAPEKEAEPNAHTENVSQPAPKHVDSDDENQTGQHKAEESGSLHTDVLSVFEVERPELVSEEDLPERTTVTQYSLTTEVETNTFHELLSEDVKTAGDDGDEEKSVMIVSSLPEFQNLIKVEAVESCSEVGAGDVEETGGHGEPTVSATTQSALHISAEVQHHQGEQGQVLTNPAEEETFQKHHSPCLQEGSLLVETFDDLQRHLSEEVDEQTPSMNTIESVEVEERNDTEDIFYSFDTEDETILDAMKAPQIAPGIVSSFDASVDFTEVTITIRDLKNHPSHSSEDELGDSDSETPRIPVTGRTSAHQPDVPFNKLEQSDCDADKLGTLSPTATTTGEDTSLPHSERSGSSQPYSEVVLAHEAQWKSESSGPSEQPLGPYDAVCREEAPLTSFSEVSQAKPLILNREQNQSLSEESETDDWDPPSPPARRQPLLKLDIRPRTSLGELDGTLSPREAVPQTSISRPLRALTPTLTDITETEGDLREEPLQVAAVLSRLARYSHNLGSDDHDVGAAEENTSPRSPTPPGSPNTDRKVQMWQQYVELQHAADDESGSPPQPLSTSDIMYLYIESATGAVSTSELSDIGLSAAVPPHEHHASAARLERTVSADCVQRRQGAGLARCSSADGLLQRGRPPLDIANIIALGRLPLASPDPRGDDAEADERGRGKKCVSWSDLHGSGELEVIHGLPDGEHPQPLATRSDSEASSSDSSSGEESDEESDMGRGGQRHQQPPDDFDLTMPDEVRRRARRYLPQHTHSSQLETANWDMFSQEIGVPIVAEKDTKRVANAATQTLQDAASQTDYIAPPSEPSRDAVPNHYEHPQPLSGSSRYPYSSFLNYSAYPSSRTYDVRSSFNNAGLRPDPHTYNLSAPSHSDSLRSYYQQHIPSDTQRRSFEYMRHPIYPDQSSAYLPTSGSRADSLERQICRELASLRQERERSRGYWDSDMERHRRLLQVENSLQKSLQQMRALVARRRARARVLIETMPPFQPTSRHGRTITPQPAYRQTTVVPLATLDTRLAEISGSYDKANYEYDSGALDFTGRLREAPSVTHVLHQEIHVPPCCSHPPAPARSAATPGSPRRMTPSQYRQHLAGIRRRILAQPPGVAIHQPPQPWPNTAPQRGGRVDPWGSANTGRSDRSPLTRSEPDLSRAGSVWRSDVPPTAAGSTGDLGPRWYDADGGLVLTEAGRAQYGLY